MYLCSAWYSSESKAARICRNQEGIERPDELPFDPFLAELVEGWEYGVVRRVTDVLGPGSNGVRKCRGRLTADNCRGLMDQFVIPESLNHEEGEIQSAREIVFYTGLPT